MSQILKNLEISLKGIPRKLLSRKFKPKLIQEPELIFTSSNIQKMLLLRHDRLGDVLVSIPIFRALRQILPNTNIDILLSSKNFATNRTLRKYLDKFYKYDKTLVGTIKLLKQISKERYDLIVDLLDNASVTSDLFLKLSKSKNYLGINKENRSNYNYIVPLLNKHSNHIVVRISQLLLPFGINPDKLDLSLEYDLNDEEIELGKERLGEKSKDIRVGINLSGSSSSKYWGKQNNIDLIKYIFENYNNCEVVVFSDRRLRREALEIADESKARLAPLVESFDEFASMMRTCDILLTPDTSVVHLASAWRKPSIVLYSYKPNKIAMPWYPYKSNYIAITTEADSIDNISISEVQTAFSKIMQSFPFLS